MSRRTRRAAPVDPRGWTQFDVACYLQISETRLHALLPQMREVGFPAPDPLMERYDRNAIDDWWDKRSGLKLESWEQELIRRVEDE